MEGCQDAAEGRVMVEQRLINEILVDCLTDVGRMLHRNEEKLPWSRLKWLGEQFEKQAKERQPDFIEDVPARQQVENWMKVKGLRPFDVLDGLCEKITVGDLSDSSIETLMEEVIEDRARDMHDGHLPGY